LGPSAADAAQSAAMMRSGLRGANQFQNYLAEIQGLDRSGVEKYGQGLPYYRSAIDPRLDPDGKRDYRPNRRVDEPFEKTQTRLTAKYLAYFTETDPKKRAQLLREYQTFRRETARAMPLRRESPSRFKESAARDALGDGDRPSPRDREREPGATRSRAGSRTRLTEPVDGTSSRTAPPPPRRPTRSGTSSGTEKTPSDILDRARRYESLRGSEISRSRRSSAMDRTEDSRSSAGGSTRNDD
jgi:hypothetical protein